MPDIKGRALRGGLAKLVGQGGKLALRLAFTVVAARLLSPEDFGLVAMVTVFIAILNMFAGAGLLQAAVQRASIDRQQMSTLFWINSFIGVVLTIVCMAIAPLVVAVYHEPRLFWITIVMGAGFLFVTTGVQHLALLERKLRYGTLAVLEFVSQLIGISIGIFLAVADFGYWALVAATVSASAVLTMSAWIATGWIPTRPRFESNIRSMIHFGGTVTLNGMTSFFAYNFDKFIIGRVLGAAALGPYALASQLINVPIYNAHTAVGGLVFSVLSRLQNDPVRFRVYFLKAYTLIISMTVPVTMFIGVCSGDIVSVLLGPKWIEAVAIFSALSPAIIVMALITPLEWCLWSIGRHTRSLKTALVLSTLVFTGCILGLAHGPEGVALGFSAAMSLWLVPHVVWALHGTVVTPKELFRAAGGPFLSAFVAAAFAYGAQDYLATLQPFLRLIFLFGIFGVVYSTMLLFVMGQKDVYFGILKNVTARSYRSPPSLGQPAMGSTITR